MKTMIAFAAVLAALAFGLLVPMMDVVAEHVEEVELRGKAIVETKTEEGMTTKIQMIAVDTAADSGGKKIVDLEGRTLVVTGEKTSVIEEHEGKAVIAKGELSEDHMFFEATSVILAAPEATSESQ